MGIVVRSLRRFTNVQRVRRVVDAASGRWMVEVTVAAISIAWLGHVGTLLSRRWPRRVIDFGLWGGRNALVHVQGVRPRVRLRVGLP